MNELQIFSSAEFGEMRTIEENGKMWFCGADVAKALGYKRANEAITQHCKESGTVNRRIGVTNRNKSRWNTSNTTNTNEIYNRGKRIPPNNPQQIT